MRLSGKLTLLSLLVLASLTVGCQTSCEDACEKLLECEDVESARISVEDCEGSCERQIAQYEKWQDTDKIHRLEDQRNCIDESSCQDIAQGICYDTELFPFDLQEQDSE